MTPKPTYCGECGSQQIAVGHLLFCTRPSCSMYDRAVDPKVEPLLPARLSDLPVEQPKVRE